ncbi:MAG TPA: CHASE3 domain-containing protein, partial [Vicinamibacterales bacterium]
MNGPLRDSTPRQTRRRLTPGVLGGFAVVVGVLVASHFVASTNLRTVYESTERVAHTFQVKADLDQLMATLIDAETGQRGFIITGDASYLVLYERARPQIAAQVADLQMLTTDNGDDQQADLDRMAAMARRRLARLAEGITRRQNGGFAAAQDAIADGEGKGLMGEIRALVARMEAREDARLAARTAQADQSVRVALVTRDVTSGVAVAAVILLFLGIRRFAAERWRAAETAENLKVTLASIGDAVMTTDAEARVTRVNVAAQSLTGWSETEAIGKPFSEVFVIVSEESREASLDPVTCVLREGHIVGLANHTLLVTKDGREIPIDDSAAPIRTQSGELAGAVVVFRDITERRGVEREREALLERARAAQAEIERASALKDQFLAVLSHELRTPLSAVLGYANLLSQGALPPERATHAVHAIVRNAQAQSRLIESLLDLSRVMAGKLEIDLQRVDVAKVVDAAVDVVRPQADAKRIRIDVDMPRLVTVVGDSGRLQQVLWNLLSNAVKFTPAHGRIRVRVSEQQATVQIEVTDTGQGISTEFLAHVFDRFKQADGRSRTGLGLGLAVVKELVQAHGGTVVARSDGDGRGSTFVVTLPASLPSQQEANLVHDRGPVAEAAQPLLNLEIVVVDDDADLRELLSLLLGSKGARVRTVGSAAAAMDALAQHPTDVLLADVLMPDEDGY